MDTIDVGGKQFELDADGHMKNLSEWNEEVAKTFAQAEGIVLR